MAGLDPSSLAKLQRHIGSVRNICILAHVDHGKTTLADSLIASNGIISQRLAGKLRYMDNREDEQERGITMKSSSITLYYENDDEKSGGRKPYLINLIDSPGHVDFSSEVSTAVRLCDGALVLVDVVEGVGAQTRACLHQIYTEQLQPVLVFNKIDRLILEMQMTPLDAYFHMSQLLEQVNAVLGGIIASDVLSKEDITKKENQESELENFDDSKLYFTPSTGNVIFCSACDGWAFSVDDFAKMYAERLEITRTELNQVLWGDFYYNSKKKCAVLGAQERAKKPMFVQFVLENIWNLYDTIVVRKNKEMIPNIVEKLGVKMTARDQRVGDPKAQIKTILGQWLSLSSSVLEMIVQHIPPPNVISERRAKRLLYPNNADLSTYPKETLALQEHFRNCNNKSEKLIAFVSKMTPVHICHLPQNKTKRLNEQELQERKEEVRRRLQERNRQSTTTSDDLVDNLSAEIAELSTENVKKEQQDGGDGNDDVEKQEYVFLAFARIFSGTLRPNMKLYVLTPKHDPRNENHLQADSPYATEVTIGNLYLLMGGELQQMDEVPAGNIVGIGGLEDHIAKTATLSNTKHCTSFSELSLMATPILRVAIEPAIPLEMPKLLKGLKLLNQADACVQIYVEPTGEHVISTLGEVHVEKCVHDLEKNYAKIKVNVSKPIVSFRETIVPESKMDMVNETIIKTADEKNIINKIAVVQTPLKTSTLRIIALPLNQNCVMLLEKHEIFFKELAALARPEQISEKSMQLFNHIKSQLTNAMKDFDTKGLTSLTADELIDRVWALGPRNSGPNILLNLSDYDQPSFWAAAPRENTNSKVQDLRRDYNSSIVNGFQLTTLAGPLCEEPMYGVCFLVLEWTVDQSSIIDLNSKSYGPFSAQLLNASKDACRIAFQNQPQRLVSPMYSCSIVVNAEMLSKMYAVIGKRNGKILSSDLVQGGNNFLVTAVLPVIESYNFAQEIRKQTSGLANPQLIFSHWEIIDIDPLWVPTTEEEITHFGEKADTANRAKFYMDSVRKRKGLYVDEKVVEHAEKQRTLSKKK